MSSSRRFKLPPYIALPILIVIELLDFSLVWIPVVGVVLGNILDGVALIVNFLAVGPLALVGIFEFADLVLASIPFAGILIAPMFGFMEIIPFHLIGYGLGKIMRD